MVVWPSLPQIVVILTLPLVVCDLESEWCRWQKRGIRQGFIIVNVFKIHSKKYWYWYWYYNCTIYCQKWSKISKGINKLNRWYSWGGEPLSTRAILVASPIRGIAGFLYAPFLRLAGQIGITGRKTDPSFGGEEKDLHSEFRLLLERIQFKSQSLQQETE